MNAMNGLLFPLPTPSQRGWYQLNSYVLWIYGWTRVKVGIVSSEMVSAYEITCHSWCSSVLNTSEMRCIYACMQNPANCGSYEHLVIEFFLYANISKGGYMGKKVPLWRYCLLIWYPWNLAFRKCIIINNIQFKNAWKSIECIFTKYVHLLFPFQTQDMPMYVCMCVNPLLTGYV